MKGFKLCLMFIAIFLVVSGFGIIFAQEEAMEPTQMNNMNEQAVSVEANLPDLIVQDAKFVDLPKQGEYVGWIKITVKNQGTADAVASELKLSSMVADCFKTGACKPVTDIITGSVPVPEIKTGASAELYWLPKQPIKWVAGKYTIVAEVDPQNEIKELNEENNTMIFATSIATLDLATESTGQM